MQSRQPIRVLHIVEATQTGVGRHVMDLIRFADRSRFEPALCYALGRSDEYFRATLAALSKTGVPLYEVPMYQVAHPLGNLRAVAQIRKILRRDRYDVMHAHSAIGGMIGRLAARRERTPLSIYTPNGWPFLSTSDRFLAGAYRQMERLAARWCDRIICVSGHERELGLRYRIAPAEKFTVIHNGIDPSQISGFRAHARRTLGLQTDVIVLGTITRFAYQKNPLGLIETIAPLLHRQSNLALVFIGEGPLEKKTKVAAARAGISRQVFFLGFRADAAHLLYGFDAFLLPSRYEGLSYAMLEAMAASLPIVTTAGGNADAVTDGDNGLIVPVGDHTALRTAVGRLVNDPTLRARMGSRSRQKVKYFTIQRQVQLTETLYDRLLEKLQDKK